MPTFVLRLQQRGRLARGEQEQTELGRESRLSDQ